MKKQLSSHELARLLLEKEDQPIFISEQFECMGDYMTSYSAISDIDLTSIEKGLILVTQCALDQPNDKKYSTGDIKALVEDSIVHIPLCDVVGALFMNEIIYDTGQNLRFRFPANIKEHNNEDETTTINPVFYIATESGFKPSFKESTLETATDWYLSNFEKYIENMKATYL